MNIISHTSKASESVKRLQQALGHKEEGLHYGNGISKIEQYQYFTHNKLSAVPWTDDHKVAQKWHKEGKTLMCRTTIKGQEGHGLLVCLPEDPLPEAKVYTEYLKHKREFRVNLLCNKLVNVREKKLRPKADYPGKPNFFVRNMENGFTTAKCVNYPKKVAELAEKASKCTESDFAGVDIGYNEYTDNAFLIEVNSGPAIEGSSVNDFVAAIKKLG